MREIDGEGERERGREGEGERERGREREREVSWLLGGLLQFQNSGYATDNVEWTRFL